MPAEDGITICSAHPGEAVTEVVRGIHPVLQWIYKNIWGLILFTAEEGTPSIQAFVNFLTLGARCSVYCATGQKVPIEARQHLGYFGSDAKPEKPSKETYDKLNSEALWDWTAQATSLPQEWNLPKQT